MIAPKSVILSLDPRGVIFDGKNDVLSRQNNYGVNLKKFLKSVYTNLSQY